MFTLPCVHAAVFRSKEGKLWTKLFIPVGANVMPVFCEGDRSDLAGTEPMFVLDSRRSASGDPYLTLRLYEIGG